MADKTKYEQVGDYSAEYDEEFRHAPRQSRRWISTVSAFVLGLATMGALFSIHSAISRPVHSHARSIPHARNGTDPITGKPLSWSNGDCGNSPEEAKALGCKYSIVLHSWLPASCLTKADDEDTEEMYKDRQWFYETAGKNLTMDELGAGDYDNFLTSFDWHVTHCMFVWKRLHRILLDPTQELDSYTANYHHTSHCVKMIGGHAGGMKDSGTKIFVKYPKCAK
ncbi:hypothetical protein NLG97_g4516 [Lecanicillium saksenae]|uniref:Uncharacterized protein n=1 Tax=Lecanicillium saksenae TaxID=468837 RepID=A0ACC1QXM6_9HYPO|nr:hypothetical protein NLG97_g4516 [Lecanicillium saksenae]